MENAVFKKRMKKHRQTLDFRQSQIKRLDELNGMYIGEVRGLHDRSHVAFNICKGIINVTDLMDSRSTKYAFKFNMVNHEFSGIGTRTYYKNCERFICYILILLSTMTETVIDEQANSN